MKERMPSIEVLKKPVEDRLLEPVVRVANFIEDHVEHRRKEMMKRMGGAMQRLAKEPTIAAALFMGGLLSSVPPPSRTNVYDPVYGEIEGESKASFEAKRDRVTEYFGEDIVSEEVPVRSADRDVSRRRERQHSHEQARPAAVEGFEEPLGIEHGLLEALLRDGYPQGFGGQGAVERIRFSLERIPMHPSYGIHGYEAGHCTVGIGEEVSEVVVTVDGMATTPDISARMQVEESFGQTLSHELAHASDWQTAAALSPEARLDLLDRVSRRLQAPGAIPFGYIGRIRRPDGDVQAERLMKVQEYFAELISTAFSVSAAQLAPFEDPVRGLSVNFAIRFGGRPERYVQDAQMAVHYVRLLDPQYHWEKGAAAREQMLRRIAEERAHFLLEQSLKRLDSPALSQALQDMLRLSWEDIERETPVLMVCGDLVFEEEEEKVDVLDEEAVESELNHEEAGRFADMRDRLRQEWAEEREEQLHRFPEGSVRAIEMLDQLIERVSSLNRGLEISDQAHHLRFAQLVRDLNIALDGMSHDRQAKARFEAVALTYIGVLQGRIFIQPQDQAGVRRYAKALRLGRLVQAQEDAEMLANL